LPYQDEEDNNLEGIICLDFLSFLSRLPPSGGVFQMLLTTPGVVRLITRAWFFRLKEVDPDLDEGYPALVHLLFQNKDKMTSTTIQEMIDAAGGTHAHLASLVVSYIDAVLPGHTDFMTSKELYLLFHLVDFVTTVDDIVDGRTLSHYRQALGTFAAALLPFGITRALANVAYGLIHQNGMKGFDTLLRQCLILLIRILGDSRGYKFTGEAFDAGLLHTIASCAAMGVMKPACVIFLEQVLPPSMIYYYDVQCLERAFVHAEPIIHCEPFQRCEILDKWRTFTAVARERVMVLNSLGASPFLRACDNVRVSPVYLFNVTSSDLQSLSVAGYAKKRCSSAAPRAFLSTTVLVNANELIGAKAGIAKPAPPAIRSVWVSAKWQSYVVTYLEIRRQ
jgi:hypothetical protein